MAISIRFKIYYTRRINDQAIIWVKRRESRRGDSGSSVSLGRNEVKWMDVQRKRDGRGGRSRRTIEPEEPKYSNFRGNSMKEA